MSNVICGTVTQDGKITSNANLSSQPQSNTGQYYVDYNGQVTNPVPVVSLTGQNPGMTFVLNAFSGGFRLYVYDSNLAPIDSSFDFVIGQII